MNNINIDNFIGDCSELIHDTAEHNGKIVQLVLISKNEESESLAYAYSKEEDSLIEVRPHTKENDAIWSIPEWDFNFDSYLFEYLENDYDIGYVTPDMHYNIWCSLNELFPEELNNIEGVQKYLRYCKDNNITKEYLDKENQLDTPDIINFLNMEPMEMNEILYYKGYIAQVDDRNYDSPRESIVYIYKSKQDMEDGNYVEQISLANDDMKNYIKQYIDSNYIESKDNYLNNEESYITFVLGYDMLRDIMKDSPMPECDVNYTFCNNIAKNFMKSDDYKNTSYSMYEMLSNWVNDNKEIIQDGYDNTVGKTNNTRSLENGMYLMNLGYRKGQPVALVEKNIGIEKQYIIAFNYRIKENKIDWAYGYYYDNDKSKAQKEFDKVLSGANLSKTFENKNVER